MAQERNPNDPFDADAPYRSNPAGNDVRDQIRLNDELKTDPALAGAPTNGARITMFAVAIAVVLGAVFYGLNGSSVNPPGTASTAQNTTQISPPAAPPGMRDVTPRFNSEPGTTTGAAPARSPSQPSAPAQVK